jgi:hypothetical protein
MAQGVLFKIVEGMIASLGAVAFQEIKLLWGAKDELNKLAHEHGFNNQSCAPGCRGVSNNLGTMLLENGS